MTMNQSEAWERRSNIVSEIEESMFAADDEAVLTAPGMRAAAQDARSVIEDAVRMARSRMAMPTRESRRGARLPRRAAPRRAMMRELLVANPRARDIVGKVSLDTMTDAEIETALTRLAASGILPEQEG